MASAALGQWHPIQDSWVRIDGGDVVSSGSLPVVDTTSVVEGSADGTKEFRFEVDGFTTGTIRVATPPNVDFFMAATDFANAWADGITQVFNPSATDSGFNFGSLAGAPSSADNGDAWYDSTANKLMARINGRNIALGNPTDTLNPCQLDDFTGKRDTATATSSDGFWWTVTNTGGAAVTPTIGLDANHPGVFQYQLNAAENGIIQRNQNGYSLAAGYYFEWLVQTDAISTGTETYTVRYGLNDTNLAVGVGTDGCYFAYTDGVNAGNWTIECRAGAVATTGNTSTAYVAGAWVKMAILVNSTTSVSFFINDVEVANSPITGTNVPSGTEWTGLNYQWHKTIHAATTVNFVIDYVKNCTYGLTR